MKQAFVYLLFLWVHIFNNSCTPKPELNNSEQYSFSSMDSIANLNLVHSMYQWEDSVKHFEDFPLLADTDGKNYIGIDLQKQQLNEKILVQSNYFSSQWIENYHQLASTIDSLLRNKLYQWTVGEMSTFITDANPWWEAQDVPENFPWSLSIEAIQYDGNEVSFLTRWWKDKTYAVRCKKEQGVWKINYLQGFDPHRFFIYTNHQ